MTDSYDLVIIGAGPAGLMAGLEARRAGIKTLLIEKNEQIGLPVNCGEGVIHQSIESVLTLRPEWILASPKTGRIVAPDGVWAEITHPFGGYILDRSRLEQDLADQFVEAGGDLCLGVRAIKLMQSEHRFASLRLETADGQCTDVEAQVFIAADGVESTITRMAGMDNRLDQVETDAMIQYRMTDLSIDPEVVEVHIGSQIAPGSYAWVFPRGSDAANVGLGILGRFADGCNARDYLDRFVADSFPHGKTESTSCGTAPRYAGPGLLAKENLLVVGDAARLVDCLTGGGICLALESGKMAGAAAAKYILEDRESILSLHEAYPGGFASQHGGELKRLLDLKRFYSRLTDQDLKDIVAGLEPLLKDRDLDDLDMLSLIVGLIKKKPRLLTLARHLF